ncbi:MAG: hypothetical protein QM669_07765, partial [Siphonobacter sp.]
MQIPIQNIYYLLCYAWDRLEERELVQVSAQDCLTLPDLLSQVLVNGITHLVKRGIFHAYLSTEQTEATLRGRLLLTASLRQNTFVQGKAVCEIDDFSANQLPNQILKSTLALLLRIPTLSNRNAVLNLYDRLATVSTLPLTDTLFARQPRYPSLYPFLLNVCELVHRNLLVEEGKGSYLFRDFWRDEKQMARLFEDFIRNFYRHELPLWHVHRENITWKFIASAEDQALLPLMQTDVSLESKDRQIILDAKYYTETFQRNF